VPQGQGIRAHGLAIAADAAGFGHQDSEIGQENQIPLFPHFTKGEAQGDIFCLLADGRARGYEIAASLSLLAMTGIFLFTGH
jgi:hypothetical protein